MIYIINYGKGKRRGLSTLLETLNVEFEIGANEVRALNADKIILPDIASPEMALRRLSLMNLYSALKMFPRPILGIGAGFLIMLEKCNERSCLGFFPYSAQFDEENDAWKIFDSEKNHLNQTYFRNGRYFGICNNDDELVNKAVRDFVDFE